jgi:hypothetical protein
MNYRRVRKRSLQRVWETTRRDLANEQPYPSANSVAAKTRIIPRSGGPTRGPLPSGRHLAGDGTFEPLGPPMNPIELRPMA